MKNEVDREKERPGQYIDSESPFCRNCTRDDCPTNGDGCKAWETYFIDNWNKKHHETMEKPQKTTPIFPVRTPGFGERGDCF